MLDSSFHLTCFSSSIFWLQGFYFYFLLYILYSLLLLSDWLALGIFLILSSSFSCFSNIGFYILLSLCLPDPAIPLLPIYWPFSFLLDKSDSLGRQDKTIATYIYIITHTSLHFLTNVAQTNATYLYTVKAIVNSINKCNIHFTVNGIFLSISKFHTSLPS